MILKYDYAIRGVHVAESLLMGSNFVSGICKLKPEKELKNLKPIFV